MNMFGKVLLCALLAAGSAFAAENKDPSDAYLTDSDGAVVRDAYNLCWRTSEWTKAKAIRACDPELFADKKAAPGKVDATPAAAAPGAPEKLTFSAGSLFDFDKAVVKPEGKKALDKLAADLKGVKYDVISATGHTDRIGSDAYNDKLSMRRAEAVKEYLVKSAGIEPTKIFTAGKGKKDPVTKSCKGKKKTKKLIACLQPDRRVVVEVSATK